jgi:hypothetical protein
MKVRNVNGISLNRCSCGSWLEHWIRFSGRDLPVYCAELSCYYAPEGGACVQKDDDSDLNWYIIPLCATHDTRSPELNITELTVLVPADTRLTCGR